VLQGVVVVLEGLPRVEGRVDVGELHLAEVLPSELRELGQAGERMEGVAMNEQVVGCSVLADLAHSADVVKKTNLGYPVVGRLEPLLGAVIVSEKPQVLVRPGQL
jgi:hypothetical protein